MGCRTNSGVHRISKPLVDIVPDKFNLRKRMLQHIDTVIQGGVIDDDDFACPVIIMTGFDNLWEIDF